MNKLLTLVVLLVLFSSSCKETSYDSNEQSSSNIVKSLNAGNTDIVIKELEEKENLTSEERYYLASAYSIKGGMDVYAIYPIMEIELFHKRAIDWDSLDEQKNPYKKFMIESNQSHITAEDRSVAWEKYSDEYTKHYQLNSDLNCEQYNEYTDYCLEQKEKYSKLKESLLEGKFISTVNDQYSNPLDEARFEDEFEFLLNNSDTADTYGEDLSFISTDGEEVHYDFPKYRISRNIHDHFSKRSKLDRQKILFMQGKNNNETNSSIKMMNMFWSLYESIPLIQRLPIISKEEQNTLTKTLEILAENIKQDPTHTKSAKMVVMIITFSLSSIFADSFELEAINNPFEMGCYLKSETLLSYHKIIRDRLRFVTRLEEIIGPVSDESAESIRNLKLYLENTSDTLSLEDQEIFHKQRKIYEIENCGANIFLYK